MIVFTRRACGTKLFKQQAETETWVRRGRHIFQPYTWERAYMSVCAHVCVCVCVSTDSSRDCIIHPTQLTHVSTLQISFLYYSPLLWGLLLLLLLLSSALPCRDNMLFLRTWRLCLLDFYCLLPTVYKTRCNCVFACMNIYCGVLITGQETEPECFVDPCHMTRERERERRRDKDALTNLKEQLSSYPEVR